MANWKLECEQMVGTIAQKLEAVKSLEKDGKAVFESFEYLDMRLVLFSMISLGNEIPEREGRRILNQSILQAGEDGAITADKLLKKINQHHFDLFTGSREPRRLTAEEA